MKRLILSHKGLTLVEIVVAIAAGVLVFGLILAIFISTISGVDATIERNELHQELSVLSKRISKAITCFIPAEEIDPGLPFREEFNEKNFTIASTASGSLKIHTIQTASDNKGRPAIEQLMNDPFDGGETEGSLLGTSPDTLNTSIEFRYSAAFEGTNPVWISSMPTGARPKLVLYNISVARADDAATSMTKTVVLPLYSN